MKVFPITAKASIHLDSCMLSIRTTENRIDMYAFDHLQIAPMAAYNGDRNIWIGKEKLFIRVGDKSRIKIEKNENQIVSYAIEEREALILIAQLDDIFSKLKKIVSSKTFSSPGTMGCSPGDEKVFGTDINSLIERKLAQHRLVLLHEIRLLLQKRNPSPLPQTKDVIGELDESSTPTFIPSRMGSDLVGRIQTQQHTSEIDATQASEALKKLKDT